MIKMGSDENFPGVIKPSNAQGSLKFKKKNELKNPKTASTRKKLESLTEKSKKINEMIE